MISVDEAVSCIRAAFSLLATEDISLEHACGRVVATDAIAKIDQPPASVSAMDGYALRSADANSTPATLRVIGTAPAGHPFNGTVGEHEAVRIFTGGIVPAGADAIVIQEDATRHDDRVTLNVAAVAGRHIRRAGLDFACGAVLAHAGHRLRARDLSLLAAGDVATISVRRRPRIILASTGDELSRPGEPRKPGGIVASSVYGLSAMVADWGGEPVDIGILPDTAAALSELPARAKGADLIVTTGGASVGDHDLVRSALAPHGFVLDFWKIAMRPGKPLIFGRLGNMPLLGLPGNPVSSLVCAILFLKPAIQAMLGQSERRVLRRARLVRGLAANDTRQDYLRARLEFRSDEWWVDPFAIQDSSMQSVLSAADALIVRAPHSPPAATGEFVDVLPLDDN